MIILKEHNEKAVAELSILYKENRTAIYVSGVGTGKSFVFMGLIDRVFTEGRILYVMPKYAVQENIEGYEDFTQYKDRIDFVTFNAFLSKEKASALINGYSFVVIDEVHHIGSDTYGKNLLWGMNHSDAYFLGMTATPLRHKDRFDVSDFFECRVDGLSNFDAIRQSLMPQINYRICIPEKDMKQVEKEYDNEIRAVLDYESSQDTIEDILDIYPRNKWICFFPNVKAIHHNRQMINFLFPGYKVFILHSSLKNLKEVMNGVKKAEKAVVLSVNILLEGVHLDGIDGIILLRNVTSLTAFQQMIGRICSIGKKTEPVVIDCARSAGTLLRKLFYESHGVDILNPRSQNSRIPSGKEVVKIGISGHETFDINKIFRYVATPKEILEQNMYENAKKALLKYKGFGGKDYDSIEQLRNSGLDYKKAKACMELFHTKIEFFYQAMKETA